MCPYPDAGVAVHSASSDLGFSAGTRCEFAFLHCGRVEKPSDNIANQDVYLYIYMCVCMYVM